MFYLKKDSTFGELWTKNASSHTKKNNPPPLFLVHSSPEFFFILLLKYLQFYMQPQKRRIDILHTHAH